MKKKKYQKLKSKRLKARNNMLAHFLKVNMKIILNGTDLVDKSTQGKLINCTV